MHSERFQVNSPVGLHGGPMSGLMKVPVMINGQPVNRETADQLYGLGRDEPIHVSADTGNPQLDRDVVHLAQGVINLERDPWPGNREPIPPEHVNLWANFARSAPTFGLGIPQEGPNQIDPAKIEALTRKYLPQEGAAPTTSKTEKSSAREPVNGEMTARLSKWHVVALGEMQQPGGVGAADYNPVLDGANPDDPPQSDTSQNSFEQDVALETWVNAAVDMLNRGEPEEAILAQLAHDGCPNPQEILQRAQEQPLGEEKPISDEIGQDPFNAPPSADAPSGQMESVSQQPPVLGSMVKEAPGKEHMKGVSDKRNRQYEHVLESCKESHPEWDEDRCKEYAARTVNKTRSEKGETKSAAGYWEQQGVETSGAPEVGDTYTFQPEGTTLYVQAVTPDGVSVTESGMDPQEAKHLSMEEFLGMVGEGTLIKDEGPLDPDTDITNPDYPLFEAGDTGSGGAGGRFAQKVRIANTSMTGTVIDRYEDTWGQGLVMVALDDGGTVTVAPTAVEEVDAESAPHPVSQIQEFIDSMEPVQPTRPHIEARIANLRLVRKACQSAVSRLGFSDQVKVASIDSDAQAEIAALEDFLGAVASQSDVAYLSGLQTYRTHGLELPGVKRASLQGTFAAEQPAIFVAELDEAVSRDPEATAYAAARHAQANNLNIPEFVAAAEDHRKVRTEEFADVEHTTTEPEIDAEGPAEQLFV